MAGGINQAPPAWLRAHPKGWALRLHIQPGASKTGWSGVHGERLKLRLAAPPVDGKANQALIAHLAEALQLPKSSVVLLRGETAREKEVLLAAWLEAPIAQVERTLRALLNVNGPDAS